MVKTTYEQPGTTLTELNDGDKIYVLAYRESGQPTAIAPVTGGSEIAVWHYAYVNFAGVGGLAATALPSPDNVSVFYYHIATFRDDATGQRVEQKHDGFIETPLVYHPWQYSPP